MPLSRRFLQRAGLPADAGLEEVVAAVQAEKPVQRERVPLLRSRDYLRVHVRKVSRNLPRFPATFQPGGHHAEGPVL